MGVHVGVIGPGTPGGEEATAEEIGRRAAQAGAVVVCGGLGGVMEAACRGAKAAGGLTVGILPGHDRRAANRWVDVAIATGLGEARNTVVVSACDVVVAVGGGYGTLSEIGFALKLGKPVVGVGTWSPHRGDGTPDPGVVQASTAVDAVATALQLAGADDAPEGSTAGDGGDRSGLSSR